MESVKVLKYIGKKCRVLLKNNWKYEGKILSSDGDTLVVDDWKDGELEIDISSIGVIGEVKNG